jgi:hypothetical protein
MGFREDADGSLIVLTNRLLKDNDFQLANQHRCFRTWNIFAALVAQGLWKIFAGHIHCLAGLTVNSTNRLLCKASFRFNDLMSS